MIGFSFTHCKQDCLRDKPFCHTSPKSLSKRNFWLKTNVNLLFILICPFDCAWKSSVSAMNKTITSNENSSNGNSNNGNSRVGTEWPIPGPPRVNMKMRFSEILLTASKCFKYAEQLFLSKTFSNKNWSKKTIMQFLWSNLIEII